MLHRSTSKTAAASRAAALQAPVPAIGRDVPRCAHHVICVNPRRELSAPTYFLGSARVDLLSRAASRVSTVRGDAMDHVSTIAELGDSLLEAKVSVPQAMGGW